MDSYDYSSDDSDETRQEPGQGWVFLYVLLLTFIASLEKVALKKATDSMRNYGLFLSELIVVLFAVIFLGVIVYKSKRTRDISPQMRAFPKYKFALVSICDTLAGILVLIPASHVSGDLMTLLMQGTVPATMIGSIIILKRKFHWLQYVGSVVILLGIVLNALPAVTATAQFDNAIYILPLFLSCLPAAMSGIAQEIALQGQEMDIYYYQFWVALFQSALNLVLSPATYKLQTPDGTLQALPQSVADGLTCWLPGQHEGQPWCGDALPAVLIYLAVCIAFNLAISLVVQNGSALTMTVSLTVAIPIQYLAFALPIPFFVTHPSTLAPLNWVGLAVSLVGLVAYNWTVTMDDGSEPEFLPPGSPLSPLAHVSRLPPPMSPSFGVVSPRVGRKPVQPSAPLSEPMLRL